MKKVVGLFVFVSIVSLCSCINPIQQATKSNAKSITLFDINVADNTTLFSNVTGTINENSKEISMLLPWGTPTKNLKPSISLSDKATVAPGNKVATDFSTPVLYTVTAEDGTSIKYTVSVTFSQNPIIVPDKADIVGVWSLDYHLNYNDTQNSSYKIEFFNDGTYICRIYNYNVSGSVYNDLKGSFTISAGNYSLAQTHIRSASSVFTNDTDGWVPDPKTITGKSIIYINQLFLGRSTSSPAILFLRQGNNSGLADIWNCNGFCSTDSYPYGKTEYSFNEDASFSMSVYQRINETDSWSIVSPYPLSGYVYNLINNKYINIAGSGVTVLSYSYILNDNTLLISKGSCGLIRE